MVDLDIVIGNPPWDEVQPNIDEFFASEPEIQLQQATSPTSRKKIQLITKTSKTCHDY